MVNNSPPIYKQGEGDLVEQLGSVNKKSKGSPKLKIRGAGSLTDQCPAGHADI